MKIDIQVTNVSCAGEFSGQAKVNVTGGNTPYTYQWSTGSSWHSISSQRAGQYWVKVTDNKGCNQAENLYISEPGE